MATGAFTLAGDDPSVAPDFLPLIPSDPGNVDIPLDPLQASITDPASTIVPIYGPSLSQLGADATQPAITGTATASDPSAFNAHPSTNTQPGLSPLDDILKIAQIGSVVASAAAGRGAQAANAPAASKKVATAKTTAGSGTGLMIFVVLLFVGLLAWAEWGSGT